MKIIYLKSLLWILATCMHYSMYSQKVTGELKQYHKTTLTFNGPKLSEAPKTYLKYRLNVTFTSPDNQDYIVPGYFAADGNAAETSATYGNKWRVHFTPNQAGKWTYKVSFRKGKNIAVSTNPNQGRATSIDGSSGTIMITKTDKTGNDFRAKGKLQYANKDFAQFDNGSYYFEVGADSPETFLEYEDFDATNARHDYLEVAANYLNGDPSWQNNKGKAIIGAVNYLANQGMNVHYFLTMNITGDGKNAYPFPNKVDYTTYDVSKLDQWQIVFDHMYKKGIVAELVLSETENSNWFEDQEQVSRTSFSNSRKLYYREMVARFGYLNIIYNIGEEANWNSGGDQFTASQVQEAAKYIDILSPYNDLISIHNGPSKDFTLYPALTAIPETSALTTISLQANYQTFSHGHDEIKTVKNLATTNKKEWIVRYSEPYSNKLPDLETWTNNSLWACITAGAAGIHYYSHNGDITVDNYTLHTAFYQRMKYAKDFFENNNIPFWNLTNNDSNISNGYLLTDNKDYYIAFLPNGGTTNIDVSGTGTYQIKWFNPRSGGKLQNGSISKISAGKKIAIGNAPNTANSSWVVLLQKQ
ncbi:DUF5060 domain-containing protein [uncultured Algibacter sp.]|uniref:DUF5060 domain-containing protein n=1 Tax=uncultured Algibacter sp. TaxID=298659 RepID=UPI0026298FBC|nr:DUF5060 domain-containing protein [uncultured Algibacter sp.]